MEEETGFWGRRCQCRMEIDRGLEIRWDKIQRVKRNASGKHGTRGSVQLKK